MFAADAATFFADFGVPATLGGVPVRVILDDPFALGATGIGMASTQPACTLPTSSVPGEPVGLALLLGAAAYTVAAHEPDGTGISRLVLEVA